MTKNVSSEMNAGVGGFKRTKFWMTLAAVLILTMLCLPGMRTVSAEEDSANEGEEGSTAFFMSEMTKEHEELLIRSVISEDEELRLAKMVYGEDRQNSLMERSATVWCAFNRADEWEQTISSVVVNSQFHGYFASQKAPEWAIELVRDVSLRYALERLGYEDVGRTLPSNYLYFSGSGGSNRFRTGYESRGYWDWDVQDPYGGEYDMMELE